MELNKFFLSYGGIVFTTLVLSGIIAFILNYSCSDVTPMTVNPMDWFTNWSTKSTCEQARNVLALIYFIALFLLIVTVVIPFIVKKIQESRNTSYVAM